MRWSPPRTPANPGRSTMALSLSECMEPKAADAIGKIRQNFLFSPGIPPSALSGISPIRGRVDGALLCLNPRPFAQTPTPMQCSGRASSHSPSSWEMPGRAEGGNPRLCIHGGTYTRTRSAFGSYIGASDALAGTRCPAISISYFEPSTSASLSPSQGT